MPFRILLAEHEQFTATLFRENLEDAHHIVEVVCTADEAIAALTHQQPDILLLDLQLPNGDGTEVLTFLEEWQRTHALPVIAISNEKHPLTKEQSAALGVVACIAKSGTTALDLPTLVSKHLR